jgi:uncharacterized protein DUF7005
MTPEERAAFWRARAANADDAAALTAYARAGFDDAAFERASDCPLPDEPFVDAWQRYIESAAQIGPVRTLRRALMQLRFPVEAGMSDDPTYVAAVRRGEWRGDPDRTGVRFVRPKRIRIFLHPTAAGRVPVIVAAAREDFVSLVRALTCRNEPRPVAEAMGACIVAGYNNWKRIAALGPLFAGASSNKSLYQDRFILLSSGPYSGVPARDLGLANGEWLQMSLTIRLEHECAHYVTRQLLGTMRNSMLDELIADYTGIVAAAGRYHASWFLRFIGLDEPGRCRAGGRIHTYRGAPPLADTAFVTLHQVVRDAAAQLEAFDHVYRRSAGNPIETARTIVALAKVGLEGLAAASAIDRLRAALADASAIVRARPPLASIR